MAGDAAGELSALQAAVDAHAARGASAVPGDTSIRALCCCSVRPRRIEGHVLGTGHERTKAPSAQTSRNYV